MRQSNLYRLFVAIDLPDEIKDRVQEICTGIGKAHWVRMEQLHLTLRFIGDADERLFHAIRDELKKVSVPPFSLTIHGTGCFPPRRDPRVLWIGLQEKTLLLQLQEMVEWSLENVGLVRDTRPFSPHITIARLKEGPKDDISPYLVKHESFNLPSFTVSEFYLYSSTLTPGGAIHKKEATYPLHPKP